MLNDNKFFEDILKFFSFGFVSGLSLGFVMWLLSWCISQLIHFFKALTK